MSLFVENGNPVRNGLCEHSGGGVPCPVFRKHLQQHRKDWVNTLRYIAAKECCFGQESFRKPVDMTVPVQAASNFFKLRHRHARILFASVELQCHP